MSGTRIHADLAIDPFPATAIPHWVILADISAKARFLYQVLKTHADNAGHNGVPASPGTRELAAVMGVSRGDKISGWLRELTSVGAIDVSRVGMPARYEYVVNYLAPDGYVGPLTIDDWCAANDDVISAGDLRALERHNARRAQKSGTATGTVSYAAILRQHGMFCHICEKSIAKRSDMHFDHVIPLARHGYHVEENILPAHAYCNLWKGVRLMSELDLSALAERGVA